MTDPEKVVAVAILFGALVGWFLGFIVTASWEDLFGSKTILDFHYNSEEYEP